MSPKSLEELQKSSHLSGGNAAWIEAWYEDWLLDPSSVPEAWAEVFQQLADGDEPSNGHLAVQEQFRQLGRTSGLVAGDTSVSDRKEAAVVKLITAYRIRGHEAAKLDPLGLPHHEPVPDLDPAFHGLEPADLDREFDTGALFAPDRMKLRDIIALCERVYSGSIGIEAIHITDTAKRRWLQQRLESGGGAYDVTDEERLRILHMLTAAEGLEHTRAACARAGGDRAVLAVAADVTDPASVAACFDAAAERTDASRLAYRQVERAYRVGEASTTDLLNATTEASDAETSQIVARAQREFQAIFLRYAVGLPPLPDLDFSQMSLADPQEN